MHILDLLEDLQSATQGATACRQFTEYIRSTAKFVKQNIRERDEKTTGGQRKKSVE